MLSFRYFHTISFFISFILFEFLCYGKEERTPDVLLCRQCGYVIVEEQEIVNIKSSLALSFKNATILGQKGMLVQTFKNPHGISFDVVTASKANIHTFGEVHPEFSWFPGLGWKMAACPRCQNHLGCCRLPDNYTKGFPKLTWWSTYETFNKNAWIVKYDGITQIEI